MAVLDPRDNSVVIRVVYDGTPMAGKTTSVGSLGRCFGNAVHSPAELEGRTLYFDWLEYTGGWFDGHRIRCQIVSVPGQTTLAPRRRLLLESADVVVFVANSSATGVRTDATYLRELQGVLQARGGVPVGIVIQANKRDLPDAVPLDQLHSLLDEVGLRVAVVESVATQDAGIREAFVLAVRLALDRVRELMNNGQLPSLPPSVDSAADLLRELQQNEAGAPLMAGGVEFIPMISTQQDALGAVALREVVDSADPSQATLPVAAATTNEMPAPPNASVASGLLWPAVDGRVILHEITAAPPQLTRLASGAWTTVAGRWRCHTQSAAGFATLDQGRSALVEWARTHTQGQEILSRDRCIALVADAGNGFRLWQVVKAQRTLRQHFESSLNEPPEILAAALLTAIRNFLRMASQLATAPCDLPLSIDSIAAAETGACYSGLVPEPQAMQPARTWSQADAVEVLFSELQVHRTVLNERRIEVLAALAQQVRTSGVLNRSEWSLLQRLILLRGDSAPGDPQRRSA